MKINDLTGLNNAGPTSTNQTKSPSGKDFQQLLDNQLQSVSETEKTTASSQIEAGIPFSPELRTAGLALTETTINTLESYSQALANSRLTGKDIEPLVAFLEEETSGLMELKEQLPENDSLGEILERVATVTYLETSKYRRGDYDA